MQTLEKQKQKFESFPMLSNTAGAIATCRPPFSDISLVDKGSYLRFVFISNLSYIKLFSKKQNINNNWYRFRTAYVKSQFSRK